MAPHDASGRPALAPFEEDLRAQLRQVYGGRRWLAAGELVQSGQGLARQLLQAGAEHVFALGASAGVGDLDDSMPTRSLDVEGSDSAVESIRNADRALHDLDEASQARIDQWDPHRSASAVVDFTLSGGRIAERPTFGARPPHWLALEDKLLIQDVWAAAGIRTAPSSTVRLADRYAVIAAHRQLASELGTVWALDNAAGWHGGAEGTHWVADEQHAVALLDNLAGPHVRVRVMPFIEGIPCSIHGMVIGSTTIAFRPIELLIYRNFANHTIVYGKMSSHFEPAAVDRAEMRRAAIDVGDELHRRVGYQGVFTLDGIMSADGFVPTEVNTRYGGALPMGISTSDGEPIDLYLVHLAVIEGELDVDPFELEAWVLADLDSKPRCYALLRTGRAPSTTQSMGVLHDTSGLRQAAEDEPDGALLATVRWGGRGTGGLLFIVGTDLIEVGPPTAPLVLEIARLADRRWNAGLQPLEPAREVRSR